MENPFSQLHQPDPAPEVQTAPLVLSKPAVSWFEIESLDAYNMRAHMEQTSSQQAYIDEQFAAWEKKFRDAEVETAAARGRAYAKAKEQPLSRVSHKTGQYEEINTSDTAAGYLAAQDPEYMAACRFENECRYWRDLWRGYAKSMGTKKLMLACLSGLSRSEMQLLGSMG
jgi:hypothetical protein